MKVLKYFNDKFIDYIETRDSDLPEILREIMGNFKSSSDLALGKSLVLSY